MKFVVHCLDHADGLPKRLANYDAHKQYLASGVVCRTVISGPLLASDNETMVGSLFIFEAETRKAVEAFNRHDPFSQAGVWERVDINPFILRVDNRS